MIAFVVVTDGRKSYCERMFASAQEMIPLFRPIIIDDSGDDEYGAWLDTLAPTVHHAERLGLGAAVSTAWGVALASGADYVFHLEDDFVFTRPVDVDGMRKALDAYPMVAQYVLRRQPVSSEEKEWGEVRYGHQYSFNPHVARAEALRDAMTDPRFDGLERSVTDALTDKGWEFRVWGLDPWVCHIGDYHSAGYRW